ncbi:hypothetical protein PLESTB_001613700 [Pleodorina starrii]|uniref:adenylate kinase n=1 Tax=Pleodorina starrii TaxID=330485 RepID=A0A9W6F8N4_9CHLO|nr:hypothetical protein PLESTB_001613700 [Pleodorina starrii]
MPKARQEELKARQEELKARHEEQKARHEALAERVADLEQGAAEFSKVALRYVVNEVHKKLQDKFGARPDNLKWTDYLFDIHGRDPAWFKDQRHKRKDDNADTLKARLGAFHSQTTPVIEHYTAKVVALKADRPQDEVPASISAALA